MCCIFQIKDQQGIPGTQGLTNAATPVVVNTAQVTAASGTLGNNL